MINQKPPMNFNILIEKGLIFIIIEDKIIPIIINNASEKLQINTVINT